MADGEVRPATAASMVRWVSRSMSRLPSRAGVFRMMNSILVGRRVEACRSAGGRRGVREHVGGYENRSIYLREQALREWVSRLSQR